MIRSLVLCYHAISDDWPAELSVTPREFDRQLAFLRSRGYRGVTFAEAVASPPEERVVAVTFDDAYRSVLERALPILERHELAATVFVPTRYPDRPEPMAWDGIDRWLGGAHEPELVCMTWAELADLRDRGWEIGSHTVTHPHLTRLGAEELADELSQSRAELRERLGVACDSIAYPYGDVDERVVAAARAAGYRNAATLTSASASLRPLRWPRVGIYHRDHSRRWRLKLSPLAAALRSGALGGAIERRYRERQAADGASDLSAR